MAKVTVTLSREDYESLVHHLDAQIFEHEHLASYRRNKQQKEHHARRAAEFRRLRETLAEQDPEEFLGVVLTYSASRVR